ncbi:MAG TPA: peptidase M48 [Methylophilaceae bacterium]|nr:peptidase M48 [Methylophilaceae bacterium]
MDEILRNIFITVLTLSTVIHLWLARRHIHFVSNHKNKVPDAFKKNISLKDHQKAAHYAIAKSELGSKDILAQASLLMLLTLGGLISKISNIFDWISSSTLRDIAIILSVMLISSLIDLPFNYYKTFKIDEKFGFNRMTKKLFFSDIYKQMILGLSLGLPILFVALWMLQNAGSYWWLYLWVVWSLFNLLILAIYPTWIAPFFNKFSPLKDRVLKTKIIALLKKCGFKSQGLFVMDGSARSNHGNAYFTGFGKNKRIVFFDTLLERLNHNEIEAVLAHELGHFHHNHVKKRIVMMFLVSFIGLAILGYLKDQLWFYHGLGIAKPSDGSALLLFMLVGPTFIFFIKPIMAFYSRQNEFEADRYAKKHSSAKYLKESLVKLYRDNASTLTPDPLYSAFYDSHPPALQRIARL